MFHRTLGDGLAAFRKANKNKMCANCNQPDLFPYKIAPQPSTGFWLCEVYCSRCGKTADSFTFARNTLNTTKSRKHKQRRGLPN